MVDINKFLERTYGQDGWGATRTIPRRESLAPEGSFERAHRPLHRVGPKPKHPRKGWFMLVEAFHLWAQGRLVTRDLISLVESAWVSDVTEAAAPYFDESLSALNILSKLQTSGDDLQTGFAARFWEPQAVLPFVMAADSWGTFAFNSWISSQLEKSIRLPVAIRYSADDEAYVVSLRCFDWRISYMLPRTKVMELRRTSYTMGLVDAVIVKD